MAYSHSHPIIASDYNALSGLTSTAAGSSGAAAGVAGYLWGVGYGDRGYGQTTPALTAVAKDRGIASWSNLQSVLANLCSWQNTATTKLPTSGSVAKNAPIFAFKTGETVSIPDLLPVLDSNRLNFQVGNMTLTSSAATTTRASTWGFTPNWTAYGSVGTIGGTQGSFSVTKTGGSNGAWETTAYSTELMPTLRADFRTVDASNHNMFGFTATPSSSVSAYTHGYAFYCDFGTVRIYEFGAHIGDYGAYNSSTQFLMTYDGSNVRYYINGALQRTVAASGLLGVNTSTYYLQSSYGGGFNNITYRPGTDAHAVPQFIQGGHHVQFASEDAARYFFNTGGEIRLSFAHSNTSTTQDSNWNSTLDNLVVAFRTNSAAKLSGNGTTSTGLGYFQLTTGWQLLHTVNGSSAYVGNVMELYVCASAIPGVNGGKGSLLRFYANFTDAHDNNYFDVVNAGTSFTLSHLRATGSPLTNPIAAPTCTVDMAL